VEDVILAILLLEMEVINLAGKKMIAERQY